MNVIAQVKGAGPVSGPAQVGSTLTRQQKAAIVVRLLAAEGLKLPLSGLSDEQQTQLTEQIATMTLVDRGTLRAVAEEFCAELAAVGLAFPGGLDGALTLLDGQLSDTATSRLRRMAAGHSRSDPWERIAALPVEALLPVLAEESTEVGAVMLSKLSVAKAAELLGQLPGEKARRIAYAVSLTGNVSPETVRTIGQTLAGQLDAVPPKAFASGPVERVGAILNQSAAATRDSVLRGLEEEDLGFAEQVRKTIFTFANIATRIAPRDVPKVLRGVDQPTLVTALAGAKEADMPSAEFILTNLSQRMAANLREEMAALGKVRERDAETAMGAIVTAIRELEASGEITLVTEEEDDG